MQIHADNLYTFHFKSDYFLHDNNGSLDSWVLAQLYVDKEINQSERFSVCCP